MSSARDLFKEVLALCQGFGDHFYIGWTHRYLARVTDAAEQQGHVDAARAAWIGIDRPDLLASLDREFGPPPPDPG